MSHTCQSFLEAMRCLLIAAIAVYTGLALPASAETWWLVVGARARDAIGANWSLPMTSEEECEAAGRKIKTASDFHGESLYYTLRYICLKGK
jgi:hypothetical protein